MILLQQEGMHQLLKDMFVEGSVGFMSLVAIALVLGLAFCIERIIYLSLSEINAKKLLEDIEKKVEEGDVEGAKTLCRNTRGPVASICYQGLLRINEKMDDVERSIMSYGSVQLAKLEKGCSWITLFIAMAPSLGFLGTVIGMVIAFDQIEIAGDIVVGFLLIGVRQFLWRIAPFLTNGTDLLRCNSCILFCCEYMESSHARKHNDPSHSSPA